MQLKTIIFLLTIFLTIALFFMGLYWETIIRMQGQLFLADSVRTVTCFGLTWLGIFIGRQSKDLSPGG